MSGVCNSLQAGFGAIASQSWDQMVKHSQKKDFYDARLAFANKRLVKEIALVLNLIAKEIFSKEDFQKNFYCARKWGKSILILQFRKEDLATFFLNVLPRYLSMLGKMLIEDLKKGPLASPSPLAARLKAHTQRKGGNISALKTYSLSVSNFVLHDMVRGIAKIEGLFPDTIAIDAIADDEKAQQNKTYTLYISGDESHLTPFVNSLQKSFSIENTARSIQTDSVHNYTARL